MKNSFIYKGGVAKWNQSFSISAVRQQTLRLHLRGIINTQKNKGITQSSDLMILRYLLESSHLVGLSLPQIVEQTHCYMNFVHWRLLGDKASSHFVGPSLPQEIVDLRGIEPLSENQFPVLLLS